jgi:predicted Co/Zn/Cd cation transporter (cation efflux family)
MTLPIVLSIAAAYLAVGFFGVAIADAAIHKRRVERDNVLDLVLVSLTWPMWACVAALALALGALGWALGSTSNAIRKRFHN